MKGQLSECRMDTEEINSLHSYRVNFGFVTAFGTAYVCCHLFTL